MDDFNNEGLGYLFIMLIIVGIIYIDLKSVMIIILNMLGVKIIKIIRRF